MNAIDEDAAQELRRQLFSDSAVYVYAVLDGASVPDLLPKLYEAMPEFECLYRGELEPDMAEVAPYLVCLEPDTYFADWVMDNGWGSHWGIYAAAYAGFRDMRKHFRKFLTVYDPEGRPMLFRYYDPRVIRSYLPTCSDEELLTVFGPVSCYMLEGEDANTLLRFRLDADGLRQEGRTLGTRPIVAEQE
jgi:hypothetical protein